MTSHKKVGLPEFTAAGDFMKLNVDASEMIKGHLNALMKGYRTSDSIKVTPEKERAKYALINRLKAKFMG